MTKQPPAGVKSTSAQRLREALATMVQQQGKGAAVEYHDPFVPSLRIGHHQLHSVPLGQLGDYDAVLILTDHSSLDYPAICKSARLVLDTRNATRRVDKQASCPIVRL